MGAHVESIYEISANGDYTLYAFVFFIQPHEEAYDFLESNFVRIAKSLRSKALLVMGDGYKDCMSREIFDRYGKVESAIKSMLYDAVGNYMPGILATTINPHVREARADDRIVFLPLKRSNTGQVVTDIIKTSGDGNWDRLLAQDILTEPTSSTYVRKFLDVVKFEPGMLGVKIPLNNLFLRGLEKVQARRRSRNARK